MSLRAYAAIKLRVPNSGIDWLDDMIREAKRDEVAGQALIGLLPSITSSQRVGTEEPNDNSLFADVAYALADAMLEAREVLP
jgi:hypothetical protein